MAEVGQQLVVARTIPINMWKSAPQSAFWAALEMEAGDRAGERNWIIDPDANKAQEITYYQYAHAGVDEDGNQMFGLLQCQAQHADAVIMRMMVWAKPK